MQKIVNILSLFLIVITLMTGQSVIITSQTHAHAVSEEDHHHDETHQEIDHTSSEHTCIKTSSSENKEPPVHSHSLVKVSSLKYLERNSLVFYLPTESRLSLVSFFAHTPDFNAIYLSGNLRPPIFF